jgi:hypothetical protein
MENATMEDVDVETSPSFMRIGKGPIIVGSIDEAVGILSNPTVAEKLGKKPGEYVIKAESLGGTGNFAYQKVYCDKKRTNIGIRIPLLQF